MKLKQLIAFVLILLMLLPILCACGDSKGGEESTPEETTLPLEDEEHETIDGRLPEIVDLRDEKGKDYVVKIYGGRGFQGSGVGYWSDDIYIPTGGSSNQIAYKVYERNQKIEESFHCRIELITPPSSDWIALTDLKRAYENGTTYDLTVLPITDLPYAATQGLLLDLNATDDVYYLQNPSFDQNSVKQLSIGNKLYFIAGDMSVTVADCSYSTVVNLDLFEEKAEEFAEIFGSDDYADIFQLVDKRAWTMETMLTMAEYANYDADPTDGEPDAQKGDRVGYFQYSAAPLFYFYGMGGRITEHDENGEIGFVIENERNEQVLSYLCKNMIEDGTDWIPNGFSVDRRIWFFNGGCLFTDMSSWDIRKSLRLSGSARYAVLPIALYEEGDSYQTLVQAYENLFLWSIPTKCTDQENAFLMLEVFAAYSYWYGTVDAYEDVVLHADLAESFAQKSTWQTIRNSLAYDVASLYDWGGFMNIIKQADLTTQNRIQLKLQRIDDIQKSMQQTIEQFKNPVYVPLTKE